MHAREQTSETVVTCPYGKTDSLPAEQAWSTLKVFHAYQLLLSAAFFVLLVTETGPSLFGQSNIALFYSTSLSYFAVTLFSSVLIGRVKYLSLVQFKILVDIIVLTLLMHSSGGITSGLGILLAVSVAGGGLMAGRICTFAFASFSTFAVLGEQLYSHLNESFATTAYTYAGALSASFFAIAALTIVLSKRVERSEKLVEQQSHDIYALELINSHIIEQLDSGVIVIDTNKNILLRNKSANRLCEQAIALGKPLDEVSEKISGHFDLWLKSPTQQTAIVENKTTLSRRRLQFHQLAAGSESTYLIFIEDLSTVDQQVQQRKLASLGGLTASIAHEIRNPLGAISHAGQLLAESEQILQTDKRLLDIIQQQSVRVNDIVKSVLNLSRLEQTAVETINLSTWLKEFETDFKNEFGFNQSPLNITKPSSAISVLFDKNQLKQIVDNLCSNALKYGQQNRDEPHIMLTLGIRRNSQQTYLAVSDDGKGMNQHTVEHIFEPFFTTSASGTGLGLFISNQLAELNHASLSYAPNTHGGSCFTLFSFGMGWFFIGHLLESTFFALEIAHEHRNYFPSMGLMLAILSLVPSASIDNKKFISATVLITLLLGATTYLRATHWGNYQRLAYFEAEHHPNSTAAQALLSNAAFKAGDFKTARLAIKKAMEINPHETAFSLHYQNMLAVSNKPIPEKLQNETLKRIRDNLITPSTKLALDQMAGCLHKPPCQPLIQNYTEWLHELIQKKPSESYFHFLIGKAYRADNKVVLALNAFQRAHELDKEYLHPLFDMAGILIGLAQLDQAAEVIRWIEAKNETARIKRTTELYALKKLLLKAKQNKLDAKGIHP